ncbi:ribokinase [Oricola cellulosilytica]|uniref:Ribokinase n=1 Tax=Oricola cellulosilytica TaxID=1429082 RepID=A0A4R0PCY3_9HYPH|nr:ribokinase [Oricola cellulosilytica]TCD13063.1 ribokinase [Oricola cellulosilytica]
MTDGGITILGVFVADTAYRAERQPRLGETILGKSFVLGPGGKGSNQSVAAARAGGRAAIITRLGKDAFAELAIKTWADAGVEPLVTHDPDSYTGAAYIFIEEATGDNAIIISPGAAAKISTSDVDAHADRIARSSVFITQLEQPMDAAEHALGIARNGGAITILNPAPAAPVSDAMLALCSYVTPNETEAAEITGQTVETIDQARQAAEIFMRKGVGAAVITLGERGALIHGKDISEHVPAFSAGPVVETTGAGDAFNGGFAVALSEGRHPVEAVRFGCATAAISVTRPGTAPSMPARGEIEALLAGTG